MNIEHVSGAIFAAALGVNQEFLRQKARRVRDLQLLPLFHPAGQVEIDYSGIDEQDVDMPELLRSDAGNPNCRLAPAPAVIGASHKWSDELCIEP